MERGIPKIWQYFGELIGPLIFYGSVPLDILRPVAEPLKSVNKAGVLIAEVLHAASHCGVYTSVDFFSFNLPFTLCEKILIH